MLFITICVGSSCSLRGCDNLASELFELIKKENLEGQVDIVGMFCMDTCSQGVSVRVGEQEFSGLLPDQVEAFFYREVIPRVKNGFGSSKTGTAVDTPGDSGEDNS